jgi:signal transduction histidine kinase
VVKKIKKGKNFNFRSQTIYDKKEYFFENYVFPDETNPGGAIGFTIDVTELKQIEQEIKKSKVAAERANQAKSYFLANMSHDIRTPIHTILGFAQALKSQNLSPATSLEYLNYIISSSELLFKLVDDILELIKIEEGKKRAFQF